MKNYMVKCEYFFGNKISDYGLKNGYVDYETLAKAFDTILNNDIIKNTIDIGFWEQINGIIDNSDEIGELTEEQENIDNILCDMIENDQENTEAYKNLEKKYNEIKTDIQELKNAENYPSEIYRYYIISEEGANILCEFTNEIIFYNEELDMYVWGVCHFGTTWDYVLTDIPVNVEG